MFGFQHWGPRPDIITLAKGSVAVRPMRAIVAGARSIRRRSPRTVVLFHSTNIWADNLAMACGLAALEVIDSEKLIENSPHMGILLMQKIDVLRQTFPSIQEVRGKGLMIAIEFS